MCAVFLRVHYLLLMGEVVGDVEYNRMYELQEQEDVSDRRMWPCRSPLTVVSIHQQLLVTLLVLISHYKSLVSGTH